MLSRVRNSRGRPKNAPAAFIQPCRPTVVAQPPSGPGWAHIIGLAAGMALALSQAQAMERDDVFDAFVAVTFYETKCGGEVSAHVKSALDSMAKSYHIEMSDPEDMKKAFDRMLARQRSLEESPERLTDFCASTKQQVEELEREVKERQ